MADFAPAFDFYPERWLAGVAHLSDAEQLRYLRLLCHAWIMDGLPDQPAILARLAGGKVSGHVLEKFPVNGDGKRRNPRMEAIREKQRGRISSARANASKRWHPDDATASNRHSIGNAPASLPHVPPPCSPPSTVHRPSPSLSSALKPASKSGQLWALKQQIETAEGEKDRLKDGRRIVDIKDPVKRERAKELHDKIRGWQKQITELE